MSYRNLSIRLVLYVAGACTCSVLPSQGTKHVVPTRTLPAKDQQTLHHALDAYDAGDIRTAEPLLLDQCRRYPSSYEVTEALGSLYAEMDDLTHALPLLEHAVVLSPHQPLASANLGAAYLKLNRLPEAVRELKQAAAIEPSNSATLNNLGQAWMLMRQPASAAKAFAAAAPGAPADIQIRYNWALAL